VFNPTVGLSGVVDAMPPDVEGMLVAPDTDVGAAPTGTPDTDVVSTVGTEPAVVLGIAGPGFIGMDVRPV
jgi:hypothetical protein